METIEDKANDLVRELDDIKESILDESITNHEVFAKILNAKRKASLLGTDGQPDNKILAGYRGDAHSQLKQLTSIIEQQGSGQLMLDNQNLQLVILAASNFVKRAERVLQLSEDLKSNPHIGNA